MLAFNFTPAAVRATLRPAPWDGVIGRHIRFESALRDAFRAKGDKLFFWARQTALRNRLRALCIVLAASAATLPAIAQAPTAINFVARDVVIDSAEPIAYLAAFDQDAVVVINSATGALIDTIAVGSGPAALALSNDGTLIAVVNRTEGSVSIIDRASRQLTGSVPVGRLPSAISALPGGGFAIANAMDDSVSVVDQSTGTVTNTISNISSVPVALTTTNRALVVGTAAPARIHVFEPGAVVASRTIDISSRPTSLVGLSDTTALVASNSGLHLIDVVAGTERRISDRSTQSLSVSGDRVYVLDSSGIRVLDRSLASVETFPDVRANAIAARNASWVALDTTSRQVYLPEATAVAVELPAAAAGAEPADSAANPEPAPIVIPDPEPSADAHPTAEPEPTTKPRRRARSDAMAEASIPVPIEAAPAQPTDTTATQPVTTVAADQRVSDDATPVERKGPPKYKPTDLSFNGFSPSPPYLGAGQDKIFREKLEAALEFEGQNAGLLGLQWENAEPDRFDKWSRVGGVDTFEGDAEFLVDGAQITTQRFVRNEETRELSFQAPMEITRDDDTFRADSLDLVLPSPAERLEAPELPILPRGYSPPSAESEIGTIVAQNSYWEEPPLRTLETTSMEGDITTPELMLTDAHGHVGELYFHADELELNGYDSMLARRAWVTTCDRHKPHYKVHFKRGKITDNEVLSARHAWLRFRYFPIPFYVPYARTPSERYWLDFEAGTDDDLGAYMNLGQWFPVSPYFDLGIRLYPTSLAGFGVGVEGNYDYLEKPASPLFRGEGDFRSFYVLGDGTTENVEDTLPFEPDQRGLFEFQHRQQLTYNTALLAQTEFWSDSAILQDYFVDDFRDRNGPRSFANLTTARGTYVTTLTTAVDPHDFLHYTEKLPEASFHLIDREVIDNVYFSFDSINGYYRFDPSSVDRGRFEFIPEKLDTTRSFNLARLTYDFDYIPGINIAPFVEGDATFYSDRPSPVASGTLLDRRVFTTDSVGTELDDDVRLGFTTGITAQSRVQKTYGGFGPFRAFKHIVTPSVSYIYRPDPTEDINDTPDADFQIILNDQRQRRIEEFDRTPTLDLLDNRPGRERIEAKLENVILAKRKDSDTTYELLTLNLYYGNDLDAQYIESESLEAELRIRPWESWGLSATAEHTEISSGPETESGELDRLVAFLFYRDQQTPNRFNARTGISITDFSFRGTVDRRYFYGAGLRLSDKWSIGFEHDFDLVEDRISRQRYEVRRLLHKWETRLRYVKKDSGFEVTAQIAIIDFPNSGLKSF